MDHPLLDDPDFLTFLSEIGLHPDDVDWNDPFMVQELEENFYSSGY